MIEDILAVYKKTLKITIKKLSGNPVFLIIPLLYSVALNTSHIIIGYLGIPGSGFIVPIIYSLILSSYFELLSDLNFYNRISFRSFKSSFTKNFFTIYSVYFVMMIIKFLTRPLPMQIAIAVIIYFLLNAISESIYIKGKSYVDAYTYTISFMSENFIHWSISVLAYILVVSLLTQTVGYTIFQFSNNFISSLTGIEVGIFEMANSSIDSILRILLIQVITAVYVLFRGSLFTILSSSTMRKRKYMGEF
ncbi:membrane protein [Peptoniphilus sp. ING2-D1G]|nr:membrane protein [Peptoniphilus sp. ING2-D1G]